MTLRWSPYQTQAGDARPEMLTPRRDMRRFAKCSTNGADSWWLCSAAPAALDALVRPRALGAAEARLLGRHRARHRRHGAPGLRPSTHAYDEKGWRATFYTTGGALTYQRHGHPMGAHAVARDAAGGVGGATEAVRPRVSVLGRHRRPARAAGQVNRGEDHTETDA